MPAPMRPIPTIPSCTSPLPSVAVMRLARRQVRQGRRERRIRRIRTRLRTPHDAALQPLCAPQPAGGDYQTSSNLIRTMGRPAPGGGKSPAARARMRLPEAEVLARDRNLLAGVVDDLDEAAEKASAFCSCPVEPGSAARTRASSHSPCGRESSARARRFGSLPHPWGRRRPGPHVVPLLRAVKQFVERALWCHVGILTAAEDLVRVVRPTGRQAGWPCRRSGGARDRGRELQRRTRPRGRTGRRA